MGSTASTSSDGREDRPPPTGTQSTDWHDENGNVDGVEFRLPHGEMIRLLRRCGFEIEGLVQIQVPEGATTRHDDIAPPEWVRRYPPEQIWKARERSSL